MTKIERVRAALRGDPLDRPPFAFWTHLPGIDLDPARLVDATVAFQAKFDFDFVKSMPNGLYCVENWGVECDYSEIARSGVAKVIRTGVSAPADWSRLALPDVHRGALGREFNHLEHLVRRLGPEIPVLATVFSPMTIAGKLSGEAHRTHLAESAATVAAGFEVITEVTCRFARAAIERGCAGVFFALQDATRRAFTADDYRATAESFARQVIAAAHDAGGWFNVLHAHGDELLFNVIRDYDIAALNWHIGETDPSIAAYRQSGGTRPIVGGLQRAHLTWCDRLAVRRDIESALIESRGRGVLLAPACVIRYPVDDAMLGWTADAIKALRLSA